MSDAIVLWRMGAVWENKRWIIAFAAMLVVTTVRLNIANLVFVGTGLFGGFVTNAAWNTQDSEVLTTYGRNSIGLAAAFISLASNLSATLLVGLEALYVNAYVR